jgi:ABC-type uncharacterized transport system permease subunit
VSARREWARRRRHRNRVVFAVAAVIVAFVVGIALGEALHDNPQPGRKQTVILTLKP